MGADDDVDLARGEVLDDLGLLGRDWSRVRASTRTGKRTIRLVKVLKCWLARTVVGQSDGHLLAVHDGLEGGPHGHLGLAVADVAAEEAVHRARRSPCRS